MRDLYFGDRPNLAWTPFLLRLFPAGTNFYPKVYTMRRKVKTQPTQKTK